MNIKAVVSVIGRDQKGVVARFATYVAEHGINIEDIEQQVVHGRFLMDMLVSLNEMTLSLDELIDGVQSLGKDIGMDVRVTLHNQKRDKKMAVLVTKEPHCLEQIIDDQRMGRYADRGHIDCVLSNHPTLEPIAEAAGVPFMHMPSTDKPAHMQWLLDTLKEREIDLVVLARYMQVVSEELVDAYRYQIINIHPSLLPHFPGGSPYKRAWESGVRVTGCTAHFVTETLDEGPIILQDVFHIDVGRDTCDDVKKKGQKLESDVLAESVRMFMDEKLVVVDEKVVFRPGLSTFFDHEEG